MRFLITVITSIASGEVSDAMKRTRLAVVYYGLAALAALFALAFLVVALYILAAEEWGALAAATGFGVGFLVIAVIVLIVQRVVTRRSAKKVARRRATDARALAGTAAVALLPSLLARRSGMLALLAPIVALGAYAVYRENMEPDGDDFD
ncbi:hypothetical protein N1F89_04140 [Aquibium sp. A9E412]|uniref:hypothetical protein n=1 Tax=Aquibium sp. A9E412 TaxID=2976767 RepID=UPI0025B0FFA8|nr:hypothetical protein [Aquibium sp. A9E412]MDN2565401.1 hypothetical protein [Aquibium sp. A9E412]